MTNSDPKFLGDELLEALQEHGAKFEDPEAALLMIECFLDAAADQRAADSLRRYHQRLRAEGPGGMALARVIFGSPNSQREDAEIAGCSHTWLQKLEADIRSQLPVSVR